MILQTIKYGVSYAAVEHAEKKRFNYLQLTIKKQEFVISAKQEFRSLEETLKEIKEQKHLFLILNNEHVLSKKIEFVDENEINLLRIAFPNIVLSDFYHDIFSTNSTSYVSIARKETVNTLLYEYKKVGISIIDFSLGNNVLKNSIALIDDQLITTSNAEVNVKNHQITDIKKRTVEPSKYVINDLEITNAEILPLSGIIAYYSNEKTSNISSSLQETFHQKQFFTIGLKVGLGFIFLILLINFLFFSSYRNEVNDLNGELLLSETYKKQLTALQDQVSKKTRLVKSMNSASNSNVSKYIDELGVSVPEQVLLNQINYQPIEGVLKADKPILFKENIIVVSGISKNNTAFSNWISVLEKKDWVQNVSIISYGKGDKSTTIANFEYIITISHD